MANPQVIFAPDLSATDSDMESGSKVKVGGYQGHLYADKISFEAYSFLQKNLREHIWIMIFFVQVRAPLLARKAKYNNGKDKEVGYTRNDARNSAST